MQDVEHEVRFLPDSVDTEQLLADIATTFSIETDTPLHATIICFDTFDWRLYRNDLLLRIKSDQWQLLNVVTGELVASCEVLGAIPTNSLLDVFPENRFRQLLQPVVNNRALLRLATLSAKETTLRFLNQDSKTVCLLFLEEWNIQECSQELRTVRIQGIRGYGKQFTAVCRFLEAKGIAEPASLRISFDEAVVAAGHKPGDYTSKFSITLDPAMTAREAAMAIFRTLLAAVIRNEPGVIADIDTEFLHDFRVAIRRTRSALSQIRASLPSNTTLTFKEEFAYLGKVTGPTRDLDVFLSHEQKSRASLPPALHDALDTFFFDLRRKRHFEQDKLVRALKAPRYRRILDGWRHYLEGSGGKPSKNSAQPVMLLARKTIFRRYGKIMQAGGAIVPTSPDESFHALRIQCKKLRYSLEFFSSLFPEQEIQTFIKQLKLLQDNLGNYNDLSVQQSMLLGAFNHLQPSVKKNLRMAAAFGGLITSLYHEQQKVKGDFSTAFNLFAGPENTALFEKLFRGNS